MIGGLFWGGSAGLEGGAINIGGRVCGVFFGGCVGGTVCLGGRLTGNLRRMILGLRFSG